MLTEYLKHLRALDTEGLEISYFFLENNSTDDTLDILLNTVIGNDYENPVWGKNAIVSHIEPDFAVDKRSKRDFAPFRYLRNYIRNYFLKGDYDYLFWIDSDVMVNPDTLKRLLNWNKDCVSCIVSNLPSGDVGRVNALEIVGYEKGPLRHLAIQPINYKRLRRYEVTGLIKAGVTGSVYLCSRKAMEVADFEMDNLEQRELRVMNGQYPEDTIFAFNLLRAGINQYLDTDQVLIHCMTEEILRDGKKAGKI